MNGILCHSAIYMIGKRGQPYNVGKIPYKQPKYSLIGHTSNTPTLEYKFHALMAMSFTILFPMWCNDERKVHIPRSQISTNSIDPPKKCTPVGQLPPYKDMVKSMGILEPSPILQKSIHDTTCPLRLESLLHDAQRSKKVFYPCVHHDDCPPMLQILFAEYIIEGMERIISGKILGIIKKILAKINLDLKKYENIIQIGKTKNLWEIENITRNQRYFQHWSPPINYESYNT